jgi:hypothetical protein
MKWQILLEVELYGAPNDIEAVLDRVMEYLVDDNVENPGVGVALETGFTEIEFVVVADGIEEAHEIARKVLSKSLNLPSSGQLIGESTRKAELVLA